MELVRVPLVNANEDELNLVEVRVRVGDEVRQGDVLGAVESTKATVDVEAPVAGFVRAILFEEHDRVRVGEVAWVITETADESFALPKTETREDDVKATAKARALAQSHGIDLGSLGLDRIIREKDVLAAVERAAAEAKGGWRREPLEAEGPKMVVFGAGGHAKVIIDLVRLAMPDVTVVAAVDDGATHESVLGVPVVGGAQLLPALRERGVTLGALGIGAVTRNGIRAGLRQKLLDAGLEVPNLVHPKAVLEPSVRMGHGNQIFAGCVIGSDVELGDNTIINSGAVVSHDCVIADHVHITPGAILAGAVRVGEGSVIGMAASVYLGVEIGRGVTVANGVAVLADVPEGQTVRG